MARGKCMGPARDGETRGTVNSQRIEDLIPVIRGLLARPSGNEDDPYTRVLACWRGMDEPCPEPHVKLALQPPEAAPEDLRGRFQDAFADRSDSDPTPPRFILLEGLGWIECVRPDAVGPLSGKVAMVTGAAGAIGAGICRALMEQGCHVIAADLAAEGVRALCDELAVIDTSGIIPVKMDVTDRGSVADGFSEATRKWGGVDIVVANAGIALVAPLTEMEPGDYVRVQKVNENGTLMTLAEAGRHMRRQGTGGDIVLVSTKNVFMPGAQFGAYSATKAAAHQLARVASQEFAPFGVRVNMVAPDAVFADGERRSGLWAAVGPSRMRARGLDEEGLEEYYRTRNLLKAKVTARHVANAVLFFVTRQTPTTGATIPVDGGLPDSTPR